MDGTVARSRAGGDNDGDDDQRPTKHGCAPPEGEGHRLRSAAACKVQRAASSEQPFIESSRTVSPTHGVNERRRRR
jgi:hypothetical protein